LGAAGLTAVWWMRRVTRFDPVHPHASACARICTTNVYVWCEPGLPPHPPHARANGGFLRFRGQAPYRPIEPVAGAAILYGARRSVGSIAMPSCF
jgi:hypothetical protein